VRQKYNKFEEDDLLYEGFAEQATAGKIVFNVVEKLTTDRSYNETVIIDGACVLQVSSPSE
jgi:hypothetical protein